MTTIPPNLSMSTLGPDLGKTLSHRTPSPAIAARPPYLSLQQEGQYGSGTGGVPESPSGATTPHGHPLPQYFRQESYGSGSGSGSRQTTGARATRRRTPTPYAKLLPLCLARIAEGMVGSIIFPYVNEMILSFGVNENDVGIWSAIAESSLMVTEAIMAPFYAPIGDRFGRRPVILILTACWGFFAMGFGTAQSVLVAVALRGALGLLAGVGVLTRTMVGELCDKTNRVQGFAVFTPALTVGFTLGPLFGGILANPVPRLLPDSFTLLKTFPYLLPALFSGFWALLASATGFFLLPETLPPRLKGRGGETGETDKQSSNSVMNLLRYTPFRNMVILYGINNGVQFAWEAFFPLFAFTSTELGGLGLSVDAIGIVMALSAGLSILMTVFVFPYLHNRLPEHIFLRICLMSYPAGVIFFPFAWYLNYISPVSLPTSVCVLLSLQMVLRRMGDFAATQVPIFFLLVMDMIPNPEYLALANSLAFSIAAVGRAIGPFLVSYFFSLSTHASSPYSFGRHIVWFLFIGICIPSLVLATKMSKSEPGGKEDYEEERHELLENRENGDY